MDLKSYLAEERGRTVRLAKAIGVASAMVSQMALRVRPVSPVAAVDIERATGGQVTRRELRPTDWHRIWPELVTDEHPAPSQEPMRDAA